MVRNFVLTSVRDLPKVDAESLILAISMQKSLRFSTES